MRLRNWSVPITIRPDEAFQYDVNGNRTGGGHVTGANNRTESDGTFNYLYDNEGNRIRKTRISDGSFEDYTWDHRNRLVNVTFKDQSGTTLRVIDYAYDIFNRLVRRTDDVDGPGSMPAADTFFAGYDGINPTLEFDGGTADDLTDRYLWGPVVDQLLADEQISTAGQSGNTLWPLTDHLGTIRDIADLDSSTSTFSITNHRVFDSFGNLTSQTSASVDVAFAFTVTGRIVVVVFAEL